MLNKYFISHYVRKVIDNANLFFFLKLTVQKLRKIRWFSGEYQVKLIFLIITFASPYQVFITLLENEFNYIILQCIYNIKTKI
jgi:hypothetical protein